MPNITMSISIDGRVSEIATPEQWHKVRVIFDSLFTVLDDVGAIIPTASDAQEAQTAPEHKKLKVRVKRLSTKADYALQVLRAERRPLALNELGDLMEEAGWKTSSGSKGMRNHGLRVAFHDDERFARTKDGWMLAEDAPPTIFDQEPEQS